MKRWAIIGLAAVMLLTQTSVSFADDRVRGRWEGVAIGLGAVTLYNLFIHGQFSPVLPAERGSYERHYPPVVYQPSGHWEIHREWIPERRDSVWIPDHYEGSYWVKGHYEVRVYPGYYKEHKAWVEGPHY
jgi:hypothetical protein